MSGNSVRDALSRARLLESEGKAEDAKKYLEKYYEKHKVKRVLARLIDLSIKTRDTKNAEAYLGEFMVKYGKDSDAFIFNYRLDKLENKADAILIKDLIKIKDNAYEDKYVYELAVLYDKSGDREKLDYICNELVSMGTEAEYIKKAGELAGISAGDLAVKGSDKNTAYSFADKSKNTENSSEDSDGIPVFKNNDELISAQKKLARAYELIDGDKKINTSFEDNNISESDISETMKPHFDFAVKLINDNGYIITPDVVGKIKGLIGEIINDPLAATISLDDVNKLIADKINRVINNADRRGMKLVADVVLNHNYAGNALVTLSEDDFGG